MLSSYSPLIFSPPSQQIVRTRYERYKNLDNTESSNPYNKKPAALSHKRGSGLERYFSKLDG